MASPTRSRLAVVTAALLFSTGGAAIKLVHLAPLQVAGLRAGIAALTLLVVLRVPWRSFEPATLLIGGAQAATLLLYVIGNKLTTAANTIFLQSTAPLYVLALSPVLLGERVQRSDLSFLALFALGLGCFFVGSSPVQATAPDPLHGNIAGVASGLTWALTVLGLRWLAVRQRVATTGADVVVVRGPDPAVAATVLGNVIVLVVCLPWLAPLPAASTRDVAVLAWLGVFQVGFAYALLARGVREVRAFDATMLMLIEPVLNPVWAWLLQGERPGSWALAGGAVILATSALRTWSTARA